MEAIAVFGGAAAILSIAVEFGKMGERLHKLVKTAPMAKSDGISWYSRDLVWVRTLFLC